MPKRIATQPRRIRFEVPEMMCSSCAQTIKSLIENKTNIKPLKVYVYRFNKKKDVAVEVAHSTPQSDQELFETIQGAFTQYNKSAKVKFSYQKKTPLWVYLLKGVIGSLAGLILVTMMALGVALPLIPMVIMGVLSSLLTVYLGFDYYRAAVVELIQAKSLSMNALFAVSTLTTLVVSIVAFFVPGLPMMFDDALLIFGLGYIGVAIEESMKQKVVQGLAFRDRVPRQVKLKNGQMVDINTLKPGQMIIVEKGGVIPVDGKCDDEYSSVCEGIVTGNYDAISIRKGHALHAGMTVGSDVKSINIEVTHSVAASYLTRADAAADLAQVDNAPIEETVSKALRYFVPVIFAVAVIFGVALACFFPPMLALQPVVTILVSACPCTLGLIVPLAMSIGIGKGRQLGITFKGGEPLQAASEVDAVVFDLNGTLTTGVKSVKTVSYIDKSVKRNDIYRVLQQLEEGGGHAVAKAIYHYAQKRRNKNSADLVVEEKIFNRSGVKAKINNDQYILGDVEMMREHGIAFETNQEQLAEQVIYLAKNNQPIAKIILSDPLREDAQAVVRALKLQGKEVYLCTGSSIETASAYANLLNIKSGNVYAACLPAEDEDEIEDEKSQSVEDEKSLPIEDEKSQSRAKTTIIAEIKSRHRRVALVGDGGNDAIAMRSCLGIAMKSKHSDEVAEDSAGIVIQGKSLRPLMTAFALAEQTMTSTKVSLAISLTYSLSLWALTGGLLVAGVALTPVFGMAGMIVGACLVFGVACYFKQMPISGVDTYQSSYMSLDKQFPGFEVSGMRQQHRPVPRSGKQYQNATPDNAGPLWAPLGGASSRRAANVGFGDRKHTSLIFP